MKHYKVVLEPLSNFVVTQPNQAFTPRQIIEQFARGEVVPSFYSPSDSIDESSFTDDQMVDDVIEFEDAIEAEQHLIENEYALESTKNKVKSNARQSDSPNPAGPASESGKKSSDSEAD